MSELSRLELQVALGRYIASPEAVDTLQWVMKNKGCNTLEFQVTGDPKTGTPSHVARITINGGTVHLDEMTCNLVAGKVIPHFSKEQTVDLINQICDATCQERVSLHDKRLRINR